MAASIGLSLRVKSKPTLVELGSQTNNSFLAGDKPATQLFSLKTPIPLTDTTRTSASVRAQTSLFGCRMG
jgi:hypothetical protein